MRANKVILVAFVFASGCAAPDPGLTTVTQPIVNGVADSGDPAVVLVRWPNYFCTGTLITHRLVLTAGHCADALGTPPSFVFFGQDPNAPGQGIALHASRTIRHPSYKDDLDNGGIVENDVSIVVLTQATLAVEPVPPNFTALTSADVAGKPITFVGFGKQDGSGTAVAGVKQVVTVDGQSLTAQDIVYGVATCQGDSGGPGLMTINGQQVVAGVTSFGSIGCGGTNESQRVDIHKDWILSVMAQYDPPTCDLDGQCATGCSQPDPDCPCQADGKCTAACPNSDDDPDCPRGCGQNGVCVKGPSCPRPDPDCGDPCGEEGHCVTTCAQRDPDCPAPKPLGDACKVEFDCGAGNACVRVDEGGPFVCAAKCGAGLAACGGGESCEALAGALPPISVCKAAPGGCAVGAGQPARGPWAPFLALLGAVALFVVRRRKV